MSNTTVRLTVKDQIANTALEILEQKGPLHYKDLYAEFAQREIAIGGKDPAYTVYAHVFYNIKDATDETPSKFIMCGKGVFGLAGKHENMDISAKVPSRTRTDKVMTIAEIDAEILRLTQLKEHIVQEQARLKAEQKQTK